MSQLFRERKFRRNTCFASLLPYETVEKKSIQHLEAKKTEVTHNLTAQNMIWKKNILTKIFFQRTA